MSDVLPDGERHYRYSVRCDRPFFLRLEAAARQAGKSVTTFVQEHLETILAAPVPVSAGFDLATFDAFAFAGKHDVSLSCAKVWGQMRGRAGADGRIKTGYAELAAWSDVSPKHIPKVLETLCDRELVERLGRVGSTGAVYQVREPRP